MTKIFFFKVIKDIKKAEFHADFKSVEKVLKKYIKKVISKNVMEICAFPLLLIFLNLVLLRAGHPANGDND